MEQYIPKKALVAKIEEIIADEEESIKCFEHRKNACELARYNARIALLEYIRSFIDNLETKDVDLEKEIKDTCRGYRINESHEQELGKRDIENIAYYFYELGLKAQKGE